MRSPTGRALFHVRSAEHRRGVPAWVRRPAPQTVQQSARRGHDSKSVDCILKLLCLVFKTHMQPSVCGNRTPTARRPMPLQNCSWSKSPPILSKNVLRWERGCFVPCVAVRSGTLTAFLALGVGRAALFFLARPFGRGRRVAPADRRQRWKPATRRRRS